MDEVQQEKFRALLNQTLDRLLNQADEVKSELAARDGRESEYVERASAHADQVMKLRIRTRESRLIKKIRQALDRLETGTFGICEDCGEDISLKRLEARPVTTKCIDCKEAEELRERMVR